MPITLPTIPTPPVHVDPKLLLLYGPPKVGKTTILSSLPDCLIVDTEDGSDYASALKIKINSVAELAELSSTIVKAGCPYKVVAIDTITRVEDWCELHATREYRKSVIGKSFEGKSVLELPQGSGYFWLRKAFDEVLSLVRPMAKHVILVGHLREKLLGGKDSKADTVVSSKDLDLTGKIKQIACSRADGIGYMYRHQTTKQLMINFESSETINCGARCAHLKAKSFDMSVENAWKQIYTQL
jgi:hypothetical protein